MVNIYDSVERWTTLRTRAVLSNPPPIARRQIKIACTAPRNGTVLSHQGRTFRYASFVTHSIRRSRGMCQWQRGPHRHRRRRRRLSLLILNFKPSVYVVPIASTHQPIFFPKFTGCSVLRTLSSWVRTSITSSSWRTCPRSCLCPSSTPIIFLK